MLKALGLKMTPEDFRNIAQGIQAVVLATAVVIGGLWAAYRFWKLRFVAKAEEDLRKTQLEKTKLEADITKLSNELSARVQSDTALEIDLFGEPSEGEAFLRIKHKITNTGSALEIITLAECSAHAAPIVPSSDGGVEVQASIQGELHEIKDKSVSMTLFPNESGTLNYLIPVSEPAIYLVECIVAVSGESQSLILQALDETSEPTTENDAGSFVWADTDYFDARSRPNNGIQLTSALPPI